MCLKIGLRDSAAKEKGICKYQKKCQKEKRKNFVVGIRKSSYPKHLKVHRARMHWLVQEKINKQCQIGTV